MEREDAPLYSSRCDNPRPLHPSRYSRRAYLQFPPPPPYPPPDSRAGRAEHHNPAFYRGQHAYHEEEEASRAFFDDTPGVFFEEDEGGAFFEGEGRAFFEGFRNEGFYAEGRTFYADEAGNVVMREELGGGMHNLAMCVDEGEGFDARRYQDRSPPHGKKAGRRRQFDDGGHVDFQSVSPRFHTKLPEVFLKNHVACEPLSPGPSPTGHNRSLGRRTNAAQSPHRFHNIAGHLHASEQLADEFEPDAYSYAYYEPGPNVVVANPTAVLPPGYRRDPQTRHTYTTRYGTEENIYEEISEVAALASQLGRRQRSAGGGGGLQQSQLSLNQSVYEVEVLRVESGHRRVLGELNLTVEDMLMPGGLDPAAAKAREEPSPPRPDLLEDLLNVGPTDELLSPTVGEDSGFSGSSAASYHSFKKPLAPRSSQSLPRTQESPVPQSPSLSQGRGYRRLNKSQSYESPPPAPAPPATAPKPGFWAKKGMKLKAKLGGVGGGSKDEPRGVRGSWDEPTNQDTVSRRSEFQRGVSSEESWCSGSDPEMSSGDESEKSSVPSIKSNGQLRSTLHKAKTLCDKLRTSTTHHTNGSALPASVSEGRLSRWFSIRRGSAHQYDVDNSERTTGVGNMPLLAEVEEECNNSFVCVFPRRQVPPSLPPAPEDLTPLQLKRRHIVAAIVHSENSYVATLQRLVQDYKKPLEESSPPILSASKISTLFHRLPEILQCHTLFRIALADCVRSWDKEERLGDVFVASFSKAVVLDVYSGFINNFSAAMDLAKMEAKRKSALADFLKVKQISAHDRLSFFGLMVKPVQRFPQFILFLQDLLKHTPPGHHDRMSLQLALTQLESLAELLNERKREAEQFQAFRETLRHLSSKFAARPLSDANRCLLREDDVTQLEFNDRGLITKYKRRRLLLLNDLVVCVAVTPRPSEDFGSGERLSLKWTVPVMDVEVVDTSGSPTLSRLLTGGLTRGGSLKSDRSSTTTTTTTTTCNGDNLGVEMNQLMHDYEVVSRIQDLAATLNGSYSELSANSTRAILASIQASIQQKDEEMAWVDSCCLQVAVKGTKGKEDGRYTFQVANPNVRKEWATELRLAQLALDVANSPAWEIPEQERRPSTKMPLFVRAQPVVRSQHQTEVRCGCFYPAPALPTTTARQRHRAGSSYLWLCTTDGASSHVSIMSQSAQSTGQLREVATFTLQEANVTAMEFVRGGGGTEDTVWMGTDSRRLMLYRASEPEKHEELHNSTVPAVITQIRHHCDTVFVALASGSLLRFDRAAGSHAWDLLDPQPLVLGSDPVSCLLPINHGLYAACGKKVWVLNGSTGELQKSFSVQHEHVGNVNLMAHSGIGLWISLHNSSTICLYHTETFKHLQDINIASNVLRAACDNRECINNPAIVTVTALMACKGLLWVGTNVGVSLTIPLPRLEGVPIISGRVNISYHAHFGAITFLLALQPRSYTERRRNEEAELQARNKAEDKAPCLDDTKDSEGESKEGMAAKLKEKLLASPVVLRRKRSKESEAMARRASKTLPRGMGGGLLSASTTSSQGSGECDVYGLYGELMYVKDYEGEETADPAYESLRRSDPELAAIPNKVSTLDRRLKMKVGRPRSLDLSNWSVDSRTSSVYTSSSEEPSSRGNSRTVSRNNSTAAADKESVAPAPKTAPTSSSVGTAKRAGKGAGGDSSRKTVITLMGGRGYVNWRQPGGGPATRNNNNNEPNTNDAHIVTWEMKL